MEFKTRYITADEFKQYFGIDLQIELPNGDNESGKVAAYLTRIENRLEAWINANYFYNVTQFWETLNNNQKEQYKYALLEQAYYVLRMGDISVDSGYDKERGVVAGRSTINELSVAPNAMLHLENGGFLNTRIVKRGGYYQGGVAKSQVVGGGGVGQKGEPGKDGLTPFIGDNGNWWIGGLDTGVKAAGQQGIPGTNGTNGSGFGDTFRNNDEFLHIAKATGNAIKNYLIAFDTVSATGQTTTYIDDTDTQETISLDDSIGQILSIHYIDGSPSSEVHYYLNGVKIKTYDCCDITLYFQSGNSKLVEIL
jgi:hypothetical protein